MKSGINLIIELAAIAIVFLIFWWGGCGNHNTTTTIRDSVIVRTVTIVDSVTHISQPLSNLNPQIIIPAIEFPKNVDTSETKKDYFANHLFEFSQRDSLLDESFKVNISRNAILRFQREYKILKPTVIQQEIHTQQRKFAAFIGAQALIGKTVSAMPVISFMNRREQILSLGYDPFNKNISFGGQFKIRIHP